MSLPRPPEFLEAFDHMTVTPGHVADQAMTLLFDACTVACLREGKDFRPGFVECLVQLFVYAVAKRLTAAKCGESHVQVGQL